MTVRYREIVAGDGQLTHRHIAAYHLLEDLKAFVAALIQGEHLAGKLHGVITPGAGQPVAGQRRPRLLA